MSSAVHPRHLRSFVEKTLHLRDFLEHPGDGRLYPEIRARSLLWIQLFGFILRISSFLGLETLARSASCRSLGIDRRFSDEALRYFTAKLDPEPTRRALAFTLRRAKRNKAFGAWIGLSLDGTNTASTTKNRCRHCCTYSGKRFEHRIALISVVGTSLPLPFDLEPYGAGDCERSAAQRLLTRAVEQLGRRFAQYVVADGLYLTAPFLHLADSLGLYPVVRLTENRRLLRTSEQRFSGQPPRESFMRGKDRIELWDAADFKPWRNLDWPWVRILRYRQIHPDATFIEAYWLTNLSPQQVSSRTLFHMAKSRWEIENQGFNDAKNRYGLSHIRHHHAESLQVSRLLLCLAMTIERLYRLRHLHRGSHPPYTAAQLSTMLWLGLGRPGSFDTS